jgi:TPP-dependent pyruvate/acetoin dehydrogenase alpha subunit
VKRHLLTAALALILTSIALNAKCADVATPAAIYLSLSAGDLGSTAIAMHNGASEGNAFMRSGAVAKQFTLAAGLTALDVRLKRPGQKKALRAAVIVVRVVAIAVNVRNAGR